MLMECRLEQIRRIQRNAKQSVVPMKQSYNVYGFRPYVPIMFVEDSFEIVHEVESKKDNSSNFLVCWWSRELIVANQEGILFYSLGTALVGYDTTSFPKLKGTIKIEERNNRQRRRYNHWSKQDANGQNAPKLLLNAGDTLNYKLWVGLAKVYMRRNFFRI